MADVFVGTCQHCGTYQKSTYTPCTERIAGGLALAKRCEKCGQIVKVVGSGSNGYGKAVDGVDPEDLLSAEQLGRLRFFRWLLATDRRLWKARQKHYPLALRPKE